MNMKVEQQQQVSTQDRLKWAAIWLIIGSGIVANQYFASQMLAIRLVVGLVLLGLAAFIAIQTERGRRALAFLKEAQVELRKVVWPTRQETIQTTFIVVIMVVVVAFFLWGIDSLLLWLIGLLTGQRG